MISLVRGRARFPRMALASGVTLWVVFASSVLAEGSGPVGAAVCPACHKPYHGHHHHPGPGCGTLGYGPPGLYPGFQGFGLGYHLGYGYGGAALGVGAAGGYPFYGGPGYPHPWPRLRRLGPITPFPYFGGPGSPTPGCPNYFGGVGPLVPDRPVVTVVGDSGAPVPAGDYGHFTGMVPYPETTFVPYTSAAAGGGPSGGESPPSPSNTPATGGAPGASAAGRLLGFDAESVVDADRERGLKVTRVEPGSAAEKAGLHPGDVIRSINGYRAEQPGNLAWIIADAAPQNVFTMSVRGASDSEVHTITVRLP